MTPIFHIVAEECSPLGWSFYHFLGHGMLIAALYSLCSALVNDNARLRNVLACLFLGLAVALPAWQVWMILERHHGFALGTGPPESLLDWMTWGALIWICAAAAISIRALSGAVFLRGEWLRGAREDRNLNAIAQRVATQVGLKRLPRVLRSDKADVLAVLGWWRPFVVVPSGLPDSLTEVQLQAVLAHELGHVARCDPLINLVQCVLESVVLFHPAAAWLAGEVRKTREYCCDDIAVAACGDVILYGRGLTALAKLRALDMRAALSANGGDLKARVVRLVAKRNSAMGLCQDAAWALLWTVCAILWVSVSRLACRLM
jgi:beta-lactamase regulating signal transducer with metallopeptidase domain